MSCAPLPPVHPTQSTFAVGYGTVFDSGTTFTYLPSAAFRAVSGAIDAHVQARGFKRTPGLDPSVSSGARDGW